MLLGCILHDLAQVRQLLRQGLVKVETKDGGRGDATFRRQLQNGVKARGRCRFELHHHRRRVHAEVRANR